MKLPWRPILELVSEDKYDTNLLLCAPELIDLNCNPFGIGMGYFQDERDVPSNEHGAVREPGVNYDGWLACKWSMTNDEWYEVKVTPTHFIKMEGPADIDYKALHVAIMSGE
jgi:hypothetical protein